MTFSEENYLKGIYHLTVQLEVSTNAIAEMMEKRHSVTDMLKLAEKI
jgi:DtxR family Mn-dependent transcriptional regulator